MTQLTDSKVPRIRFKGFAGEWEEKMLGELATFSKGQGYSKSDLISNGTPIVLYGRLYVNYQTEVADVDTFVIEKKGSIKSTGKEVVVPASGETSEDIARASAILKEGIILGGDLNIVYPCAELNPSFLALTLSNGKPQMNLARRAQGKTVVHVRKADLESILILYLTPAEQTQIGGYFREVDRLIGLQQRKHDKLVTLKKAMLQAMFPQPGATTPKIRFKGFSGAWAEKKLGELATFSKGQGYSKSDLISNGTPIVLYGRLYVNYQTEVADVDTFVIEKKGSIKSTGKEVVVPASGETSEDIARASAILKEGIILGGDLNIVYPCVELNPSFLALTLSNGKPQMDLARRAQGKTVVHVRKADLESILILYPTPAEQQKIGHYFRTLDELISRHALQLQKLKQLKSAFLERMFV